MQPGTKVTESAALRAPFGPPELPRREKGKIDMRLDVRTWIKIPNNVARKMGKNWARR